MNLDTHTYIGKRRLGSTAIDDFTNYQGVGHDPLYKRYESVNSIVKRVIDPAYAHFLAAPAYSSDTDSINWYIDNWNELPQSLATMNPQRRQQYEAIKQDTLNHYKNALSNLSGEDLQVMIGALVGIRDEFIYGCDGKVFALAWGMEPDGNKHITVGQLVQPDADLIRHKVTFDAGSNGEIKDVLTRTITVGDGQEITANDIPIVTAAEGFKFTGWNPNPLGYKVTKDITFTAAYVDAPIAVPVTPATPVTVLPEETVVAPAEAICHFNAGASGVIAGNDTIVKPIGSTISPAEIPTVKPNKGYKFTGWSVNPANMVVSGNATFDAKYSRRLPWYKRWWIWLLTGLLALLLLLLLSWLFPDCAGCRCHHVLPGVPLFDGEEVPFLTDENGNYIGDENGNALIDNGQLQDIPLNNDQLPPEALITPPVYDNGEGPQLIDNPEVPGGPQIIADRLVLFMEDDNGNLDALARDFKQAYPGDQYRIIGMDRYVKSITIKIPANERETIRETINGKIPNHRFFAFDDAVMSPVGGTSIDPNAPKGWHLKAVQAPQAWAITQGSPEVVVAVVDDGFDRNHPIFQNRIVKPYNIFTKSDKLAFGEGHGTHVAALAVGSRQFEKDGVAGIAPNCKLMPIQVFDNTYCLFSNVVSGIMYAIHNGADVVNVSVELPMGELAGTPESQQLDIARKYFKDAEKVFNRVCDIAARKNTVIVFAAGNSSVISQIPPENRPEGLITVGAIDNNYKRADFTNYGEGTDLSAPGVGIYSAYPRAKFEFMDGTSMAAPIVSGAVALLKSQNKRITVAQAKDLLYRTGLPVGNQMPPLIQIANALRGDFNSQIQSTPYSDQPLYNPNSFEQYDSGQVYEPAPYFPGDPNNQNFPFTDDSPYDQTSPNGQNYGYDNAPQDNNPTGQTYVLVQGPDGKPINVPVDEQNGRYIVVYDPESGKTQVVYQTDSWFKRLLNILN